MNHDQSIEIAKLESDGRKAKQKICFGDLESWFVPEEIVFLPRLKFCVKFFDGLKDLTRVFE